MPIMENETVLLAFVIVVGLAVVLQTIILLAIFLVLRKAAAALKDQADEVRSAVMPLINNTREFCARVGPKIEDTLEKVETTVDDLSGITRGLRIQTAEVQASTLEIMERVRRQSMRLDSMFSGVLNTVERAGGFVADVVSKPVRQITGVVASVKAIVDSLRAPGSRPRQHNHTSPDGDGFV
jgi:hypothetical protein